MPLDTREVLSRLSLLPLDSLKPHEEYRDDLVQVLRLDLQRRRVFLDPLIVDEKTLTVLDGTHRLEASKLLGLVRVPVYLVPLDSDQVRLGRWFRAARHLGEVLTRLDVSGPHKLEALARVERRECSFAVVTSKGCYLSKIRPQDIWQAYQEIKALDRSLGGLGLSLTYVPDHVASAPQGIHHLDLVYTAPVTKAEVVTSALHSRLLPHKTTRHVVEGRPIGLKFPIKWLTRDVGEPQALDALHRRLDEIRPRVLPGGRVMRGRLYQESLTILG